jgi:hypothetical protein
MSRDSGKSEKEKPSIAQLDAYRTSEEHDALLNNDIIGPLDKQVIDDLNRISELFRQARPDHGEIPESVDDIVLGHIKEKGREIRRARKIVRLFPRWEWAAAAVMGVLVCVVSFYLFFRPDRSVNTAFNKNIELMSAEQSPKDLDGNGRIDIIDAYIIDRRLASGDAMPEKMDLNGDGNINHADMVAIVNSAVSVRRRDV